MYTLFRAPCLMEDAGRHFHMGTFQSREEMDEVVRSQLGYFTTGNFYYFHDDAKKSDFEHLKAVPKAPSFMEYARSGAPLDF